MVTDAVVAEGAVGKVQALSRSFTPGWLDVLVGWIDRLPGSTWLTYIGLLGLAVAFTVLKAAMSSRGLFGQDPLYFGYAFVMWYPLAAYHYLSNGALSAWEAFRSATDFTDAEARRWQLELSTTPARPAAVLFGVSALTYTGLMVASPAGFDLEGHSAEFVVLRVVSEALWLAPVVSTVAYLLFRQLRIVSRLHRAVARVDLFRPAPLQAMARLTARSALVLLAFQVGAFLPNLSEGVRVVVILLLLPAMALALAAFVLPLRGIQSLLDAEKARRQAEVDVRLDATTTALHRVVDGETGALGDAESSRLAQVRIDALNKAFASLLQEREFVANLSTWPWDTSTLRAVVSAVALPIALFLVTTAIDRFLL
jgi:hypothetical protein